MARSAAHHKKPRQPPPRQNYVKVLRSITGFDDGASYRVKRAIRSLVDYSAPCLIFASPALLKRLNITQNQALRLIFSISRWTKVLNLRAKAQLPSLHHQVCQLTAKMAHSPLPYSARKRVLTSANYDPVLFPKTWACCAPASLSATNVTDVIRDKEAYNPHHRHHHLPGLALTK